MDYCEGGDLTARIAEAIMALHALDHRPELA